jgi:hypothetical protein
MVGCAGHLFMLANQQGEDSGQEHEDQGLHDPNE